MNNEKVLKTAGMILSITGTVVSLAASVVADKQLDLKIAKQVSEQLRRR